VLVTVDVSGPERVKSIKLQTSDSTLNAIQGLTLFKKQYAPQSCIKNISPWFLVTVSKVEVDQIFPGKSLLRNLEFRWVMSRAEICLKSVFISRSTMVWVCTIVNCNHFSSFVSTKTSGFNAKHANIANSSVKMKKHTIC
jgi:hypothetical protein